MKKILFLLAVFFVLNIKQTFAQVPVVEKKFNLDLLNNIPIMEKDVTQVLR